MKVEIVTMTPALAETLLARNLKNRILSRPTIAAYARDMAEGKWQENGSAIVISKDDVILDGQHRMIACVQSGASFRVLMVTGVDEAARQTIDTGRSRSVADEMTMRGIRSGRTVAGALRLSLAYLDGEGYGRRKYTSSEVLEHYDAYLNAGVPVEEIMQIARLPVKVVPCAPVMTVGLLSYLSLWDTEWLRDFVTPLQTGADLRMGDARLALRNTLLSQRARSLSGNLSATSNTFRTVCLSWNAYISGRPVKYLKPGKAALAEAAWTNIDGAPSSGSGRSLKRIFATSKYQAVKNG